jgi:DNA replication protein DnaC
MAEWSFSTLPRDVDNAAKERAVFFANKQTAKQALYVHGAPGQGKTGLAISIIQEVMRRGEDAIFLRSLELMDRLRESIHKGSTDGDELLSLAQTVTWLALDDLAVEKPTAYVIQELKAIVEARMDKGLFTIFTSNFSLKQLEDYWRPSDMQDGGFHAGKRVIERIAEYSEGVQVKGRNLRLVKDR